ncbi:MAG TPA: TIGR03621 family F420-dependent LLM class oxidoreductase [Acidimicrobiales bacterium]|nr:TIGR03621 family F420-dependent LLM class oxidoreductase [Acidimicrobiales bacterium]
MHTRRPVRTGIVAVDVPASRAEWRDRVRRIDGQGHDVLLTADHLGLWPPLPPLVAAAEVSDRLRFGTQVLNAEFWNPVLLAREAAAVDVLTGGRLELGFGAGHDAAEFAAAGIAYDPPAERVARLAEAVPVVRRLLAGERVDLDGHRALAAAELGFASSQSPLPIMVGGNGDRVLALAAREADIVSFVGVTSGTGRVHTNLSHFTWDGLADRIAHVRRQAGEREGMPELSVLVQQVEVTGDRRAAAEAFAQGLVDTAPLLDSPFVLLGTAADIADQLARLREAGVGYVTTFERCAEALAAGVAAMR